MEPSFLGLGVSGGTGDVAGDLSMGENSHFHAPTAEHALLHDVSHECEMRPTL